MQIQVDFRTSFSQTLPASYQYHLQSLIYQRIREDSEEFGDFLHQYGFSDREGKRRFKLFTFSALFAQRWEMKGDCLQIHPGWVTWHIRSPVEPFLRVLCQSFLREQEVRICDCFFEVARIRTVPEPEISSPARFVCLSPLTVARHIGANRVYLSPWEEEWNEQIRLNLIRKYEILYGQPPQDPCFWMVFDKDYIARRQGRFSKLIEYKGGKIRGWLAPFTAEGSVELLRVGYAVGFGEKNSAGFGMVRLVEERSLERKGDTEGNQGGKEL